MWEFHLDLDLDPGRDLDLAHDLVLSRLTEIRVSQEWWPLVRRRLPLLEVSWKKIIHEIFKEKNKNIFLLFHRILSPEIIMNELVRDNI